MILYQLFDYIYSELSKELGMPLNHGYHTGIRRDETNKIIFRRSGDGLKVNLEGWLPNRPSSNDGYEFLLWYFFNNSYINTIFNTFDDSHYFICEY